ncbi:MAG: glycosyltransferase family 4 protein [Anaerolineae bacterium]|nr:glycosyltransferase family 4 protein [Anaerolineae bacterium]
MIIGFESSLPSCVLGIIDIAWARQVAHWIVDAIAPETVLVIGAACSALKESLNDLGIYAQHLSIPETQPVEQHYDLVVAVDVSVSDDGIDMRRAIAHISTYSDDVLFVICSLTEGTVSALSPENWSVLFSQYGFVRDLAFEATPLCSWSARFRRAPLDSDALLAYYERYFNRLERENRMRRKIVLEDHRALVQAESKLVVVQAQVEALRGDVQVLQGNLQAWERRWADLERGILWPWIQRLQNLRAKLMPPGSRREQRLERLFHKPAIVPGEQVPIPPVIAPTGVRLHKQPVNVVIHVQHDLSLVQKCLAAFEKCTRQPYTLVLLLGAGVNALTRTYVENWAASHQVQVVLDKSALAFDSTYIAWLDTGIQVTENWLDRLLMCLDQDDTVEAVEPLTDSLLPSDLQMDTLQELSELVERASGGMVLPVYQSPGRCVLSKRGHLTFDERTGICDAVYVHAMLAESPSTFQTQIKKAVGQDHIWLGAQARLRIMKDRQDCVRRGRSQFAGRSVLFLLPEVGLRDDVCAIINRGLSMRALGTEVALFILREQRDDFERAYPGLELPVLYGAPQDLIVHAKRYDAVVATFNTSVQWLSPLAKLSTVRAYYVQRFEPDIYEPGTPEFQVVRASYNLFPDLVRFTSTDWVRRKILHEIGVEFEVIGPSLDLDLFRPRPVKEKVVQGVPLRILALVHPSSAYRIPELPVKLLRAVAERYRDDIEIYLWRISPQQEISMPRDFAWKSVGVLESGQVAHLLAMTDVFIDLSEHQPVGITAMEAMACGNAIIVPRQGWLENFVQHKHNALVVDTSSEQDCVGALQSLIEDQALRERLRANALREVLQFFPEQAAYNILNILFEPAGATG